MANIRQLVTRPCSILILILSTNKVKAKLGKIGKGTSLKNGKCKEAEVFLPAAEERDAAGRLESAGRQKYLRLECMEVKLGS